MHRLYHHPLSPFCRKVRLCLAEKGLEVELVEERYWEQRPEFQRISPTGKVPALRLEGTIFNSSQAITEYLDEEYSQPALLPHSPKARYEARRIVDWFDDKFYTEVSAPLLGERVMKKITGQGHPDSSRVMSGLKRARFHIDYMDWLLDSRKWLAGDRMTLADFAAAAHISCLDYISDVDWTRSELVKEWYAKIKSRPAFRSILADHVPGFRPPAHYSDLDF